MLERHWCERNHKQGIFAQMMVGLAADHGEQTTIMIDATYLKAHRTATSSGVKKGMSLVAPLVRAIMANDA